MASYLITGGCGFIGSHLADALVTAGHTVRIVDDLSTGKMSNKPAKAELVCGDIADRELLVRAMSGVDGCFHLAAVASVERGNQDWLGAHRVNLTGSITVFDAARIAQKESLIPVVYASSAAVYGDNNSVPLREDMSKNPVSAYGADKLGSEHHAFVAGKVHKVPTCGLRFFNVYGPRQDPNSPYSGVISIFCSRLKAGQSITIYGDGQQTRDFIYVGDVVRALAAAMSHASVQARVYNVCTGHATSLIELAHTIGEILGAAGKPSFGLARAGEVRDSLGCPTAAAADLGFRAVTDLRTGLVSTLAPS